MIRLGARWQILVWGVEQLLQLGRGRKRSQVQWSRSRGALDVGQQPPQFIQCILLHLQKACSWCH